MSVSLRWSSAVAAAALLFLGSHLNAQNAPQVMAGGPPVTQGQLAYNVGVLGNGVAPFTYNAAAAPAVNVAGGAGVSNPYALSTVGNYNPYLANSASLSQLTNPYGLSTTPSYNNAALPYYPPYMYGGLGPTGSSLMGYGYALQGMASLTSANAQYWKDIQTASLQREGVRQAALDTARRRIEFEAWYDTVRPTAPKMRDKELATDLDTARRSATNTDILSGKALNTLLGSIQKSGRLNSGPPVAIEESALKGVNLTGGSSPGGVGMLKDGGKLSWPEGLREPTFDESRRRLQENLVLAVLGVKDGEAVPSSRLADIRRDFKTLTDKLEDSANELLPSQYIEASRYLRQLGTAIKALTDTKVANYFNNTWQARGKSAAELAAYLTKEGLMFAPATPGDEAAYRAVYDALRAYEAGLQLAQK
jgi:hypothetical protein